MNMFCLERHPSDFHFDVVTRADLSHPQYKLLEKYIQSMLKGCCSLAGCMYLCMYVCSDKASNNILVVLPKILPQISTEGA